MNWRKEIFPSDLNEYRTRKQILFIGICEIFDGLVTIFSFGNYRAGTSVVAGTDMLLNASRMRKKRMANPVIHLGDES
jgi:hypothetical protein